MKLAWRSDIVTGSNRVLTEHLQRISDDGWEFVSFCQLEHESYSLAWTVIAKKETAK